MIEISRIDHFVLTCRDVEVTAAWYERVLGFRREIFGSERRVALHFGTQKINLHPAGREYSPPARQPTVGSADFCLITEAAPADIVAHLMRAGVDIEEGPVTRTGALGQMMSVYCRDPDGNLIEIATYFKD
jgi:catechol 2,3-dioxygenase-like lactoylglutathione lyase family enzyme